MMSPYVLLTLFLLSWRTGVSGEQLFKPIPQFDNQYSVEGVIILPYAEIRETFTAYYDQDNERSRVDYYGNLVQTVQRGDRVIGNNIKGVNYRISYMVNRDGVPERVCFQVNGSTDNPVTAQNVIPDLSQFTYVQRDYCPDWYGTQEKSGPRDCEKWVRDARMWEKESKYTFWLKRDAHQQLIPVHYLMMGYNTLFGSHYDEYRVAYRNYQRIDDFIEGTFDIVDNYTCRSFPGPGVEHVSTHNPIKEFVHGVTEHVDRDFDSFKTRHNKTYDHKTIEERRKANFLHNHRFVHSSNRKATTYTMALNHFADFSDAELRTMRGRLYSTGYNGGKPYKRENENAKIPDYHDWRLYGAVNPVKDQAVCGSCWSFGTTGTIEGQYFAKTGHLVRLSEQQLIDCSWQKGDNGCNGGEDFRAYSYIMEAGGIALNEVYGGYLGQDGKCHDHAVPKAVQLDGWVNVTAYNQRALEAAIYENGPVTVAINANPRTFTFYSKGVYSDPSCKGSPEDLDHQVLAVGYGQIGGHRFWLIKNSWSTYWGNDGYVLISQDNNMCGVTTNPTFPIIKL